MWHAKPLAEQWTNLGKIVGSTVSGQIPRQHSGMIRFGLGIADNATKLLDDLVELLEFAAKGVALFFNRGLEHVE